MDKKDKPITESNFGKLFQKAFKPAFDKAFEPYAVAIQGDFNRQGDRFSNIEEDLEYVKDAVTRIERRQIAETGRKDLLTLKLENHEKRIFKLEKGTKAV